MDAFKKEMGIDTWTIETRTKKYYRNAQNAGMKLKITLNK